MEGDIRVTPIDSVCIWSHASERAGEGASLGNAREMLYTGSPAGGEWAWNVGERLTIHVVSFSLLFAGNLQLRSSLICFWRESASHTTHPYDRSTTNINIWFVVASLVVPKSITRVVCVAVLFLKSLLTSVSPSLLLSHQVLGVQNSSAK
jgi:hypothetical protein